MSKAKRTLTLQAGQEVHGPDGWITLSGDCTVDCVLDRTNTEWHYTIKDEDWWVPVGDFE